MNMNEISYVWQITIIILLIYLGWVGMGSRDLLDRGRTHKKNHDIGTWNIGT